jgi:hypothetical protein
VTAPAAAPAAAASAASSPGPRALWRRARGPVALVLALTALAVVVSIGTERPPEGILEPEGPNPEGARALVAIAEDRGADVTVARDAATAADALTGDAVLVVALPHRLTRAELDRLAEAPGDRLLVRPTGPALEALAPGVRMTGRVDDGALDPRCDLPEAAAAGTAATGGELYTGPDGTTACYPADGGAALVRVPVGGGATATVLGTRDPLTNTGLAAPGNAALALNLVGTGDVVWLLPDVPAEGGRATIWELLPAGLRAAPAPLAAALLLLAFWQGRRLGPLVTERLPVVVRAAETTEGRAALYAARRARDRAAAALREGFAARVRPALGLGPDAPPDTVAAAVADRTGADPARVRALLSGPPDGPDPATADDAGLVRLADDLDRLDGLLR